MRTKTAAQTPTIDDFNRALAGRLELRIEGAVSYWLVHTTAPRSALGRTVPSTPARSSSS